MRPINADDIFPWYVEAFKGEIEPHDVRFSMHDIEMNLSNIPTIYISVPEAISIVRAFIDSCDWLSNGVIQTPDGAKLLCDWGYVKDGLDTLQTYFEFQTIMRKHNA